MPVSNRTCGDFQEPWRQHGAPKAQLGATLWKRVAARVQGQCRYAETEEQDLDLAKRAKNLGLSVELTLLFDGGGSASVPAAWANDTLGAQLQKDCTLT